MIKLYICSCLFLLHLYNLHLVSQVESAIGIRSGTCALFAQIKGGLVVIEAFVGLRSRLPLI